MEKLNTKLKDYIQFCQRQKCLKVATIRAYATDLAQFANYVSTTYIEDIVSKDIELYIIHLHSSYKPKTAKRKIASLKAFFHYCEFKEIIPKNPFNKVQIRFREPVTLPKTISLTSLEFILTTIYNQRISASTP